MVQSAHLLVNHAVMVFKAEARISECKLFKLFKLFDTTAVANSKTRKQSLSTWKMLRFRRPPWSLTDAYRQGFLTLASSKCAGILRTRLVHGILLLFFP